MRFAVAVAAGLLLYGAVSNLLVGDAFYTVRNLLAGVVLVGLARERQLSWSALGLAPERLGAGMRWGIGAAVVVAAAVVAGVALADRVPAIATLLSDQRAAMARGGLLYHTLWRIPVGTAMFEELAFRGVLLALLLAVTTPLRAVLWSSLAFGLWHVSATIVTLRINEVAPWSTAGVGAIMGAVVVTAAAGVVFCLLRVVSGSIVAPMLAHWATNALGLLAAAHAQRAGLWS